MPDSSLRISLLRWTDFNMVGEWVWNIFASKKDGGTYLLEAEQTEHDSKDIYRLPTQQFSNGYELKEAFDNLFRNDNFSDIEIDWNLITNNLKKLDLNLALEFEAEILKIITSEDEQIEEDLDKQRINNLIAQSIWNKSTLRDALGMGALIENSAKKAALFEYISQHLIKSGQLPQGEHLVEVPEIPKLNRKPQQLKVIFPKQN